jgi:hypothetical protein
MAGTVIAVSRSAGHSFSKPNQGSIRLVEGLGVESDAHLGVTVQHRSRVAKDPTVPNLRQVHLIHAELIDELEAAGFRVRPGDLGENITTRWVDLLGLPAGAILHLGAEAVVEVTGLRNPCRQLNDFQPGLMNATLDRDAEGNRFARRGSWRSCVPAARSGRATGSRSSCRPNRGGSSSRCRPTSFRAESPFHRLGPARSGQTGLPGGVSAVYGRNQSVIHRSRLLGSPAGTLAIRPRIPQPLESHLAAGRKVRR